MNRCMPFSQGRRRALKAVAAAGLGAMLLPVAARAGIDPCCPGGAVRPVANPIDTSLFEMFKIGPGPSSSHTIAPMKAGKDFLAVATTLPQEQLAQVATVEARLYGSLSATGKGHGTDRALLAGLLGHTPEDCPSSLLDGLLREPTSAYTLTVGGKPVQFTARNIVFDAVENSYPFSNTLVLRLLDASGGVLAEREYYSVGGGFLQWKGWAPPERGKPVHAFDSMNTLLAAMDAGGVSLTRLMLENEQAVTGLSEKEVWARMDAVLDVMEASVRQGLAAEGLLNGPYNVERRAKAMFAGAKKSVSSEDRFVAALSAYAQGSAEENSVGHRIVTAPTAGSAGVMPGVVHMLATAKKVGLKAMREGMLAAGAVGMLAKRNASIAGADVGCQGEIGVASSMSAALIASVMGKNMTVIENAAELALEHHLGMTCDPVGGYVQIPCISRCAMGAVKAYNAYLMAATTAQVRNSVGLDVVIRTMAATGKDMLAKYRETSQGGLALYLVSC